MTTQRVSLDRPSPFRRRRFVVPHRRRSRTLVLLKPFLAALVLVGLPLLLAFWVYTSPRFQLREVHIGSTVRVSTSEIEQALQPLRGRHLLGLSLEDVEGRLVANRWIRSATIRKELPNRLLVQIQERQPAALLRQDGELLYVDNEGFVMGPYDPAGPVDLLLLSSEAGAGLDVAEALAVATELQHLAPAWSRGLSEIEALGLGDYRVHSAQLEFPILLHTGDLEIQVAKLEMLLPEISARFSNVAAVDLRFTRQIVIQPAGEPRSQEG